jgi:predicted O-methyltransferase YrrM
MDDDVKTRIQNLKNAVKTAFDPIFWRLSKREFSSRPKLDSPDDVARYVQNFKGYGWYRRLAPFQRMEEFVQLLNVVRERAPKRALEIGTARGGSLFAFAQYASELLISIDLPGGKYGNGYPEQRRRLYESFSERNSSLKIVLIAGDSHSAQTQREITKLLDGKGLDFAFIDGDHSYEGVKMDFEFCLPLMANRGIIALHDICHHNNNPSCQVDKFWAEIKVKYPVTEIIADTNQGWAGIGIVELS